MAIWKTNYNGWWEEVGKSSISKKQIDFPAAITDRVPKTW